MINSDTKVELVQTDGSIDELIILKDAGAGAAVPALLAAKKSGGANSGVSVGAIKN